jgi:hypothetical protein
MVHWLAIEAHIRTMPSEIENAVSQERTANLL